MSDENNPSNGNPSTATPVQGTLVDTFVFHYGRQLARHVSEIVAAEVRKRTSLGKKTVLGLATGSTPVETYRELIRMHQEENLDLCNVEVFLLGEYIGLPPNSPQSHGQWIMRHFVRHTNIPENQVHVVDVSDPTPSGLQAACSRFEDLLSSKGGLQFVICGIGRNGHLAYNEPFSVRNSRTRPCTLDPVTRQAAASDFFGLENVPTHAITMGMGTIFQASNILLLAMGEHKASVVTEAFEGGETDRLPVSFLQQHRHTTLFLDRPAAGSLTGIVAPWLLGNIHWNDPIIKRAVLWLCNQTGKSLLKLDDNDFRDHDLHQLLRHHGPAQKLAHRVFRWMMDTIDYHPAGKEPKTCLCFSPHPDDDVISMGGSLIRLVEDGHQVHIAYMTSGNIAVFDHDAMRIADMVSEYLRIFSLDPKAAVEIQHRVHEALSQKTAGQPDAHAIQKIKGLIRWTEARAGANKVGCHEENLHFLDLPFYRTGTIDKLPVGDEDIRIIRDLLEQIQPDIAFVAGDLADPHGTHRVCAQAIFQAIHAMKTEGRKIPNVLLYRGAWQEYALHEIEQAVPLSPSDMDLKRKAIFMHESQKDEALFPGSDPREFWQRAEDRNRKTADGYNHIGLPEFYALEAFTHWDGNLI